jgi:hypothetical protein
MKYLVALKPLTHNTFHQSYAILLEIEWKKKLITRSIKIPSASFSSNSGYMRSNLQGIAVYGDKIYLSLWNFIVIVDYQSFDMIDSFSHPLMADLHGIAVTDSEVLVCSTAIDTLLCFDRSSQRLKWHWRPDDSQLDSKVTLPKMLGFFLRKTNFISKVLYRLNILDKIVKKIKIKFEIQEYRGLDKTRSMLHFHHLNEVAVRGDEIYILTKGWNDSTSSSMIKLNMHDLDTAKFIAPPGTFSGAHDILFNDNYVYVTESHTSSIGRAVFGESATVRHWKIANEGYFVRGLCGTDDNSLIVGFTPPRDAKHNINRQPFLREYSSNSFDSFTGEMCLNCFYSDSVGGAIHCIKRAPIF